MEAGQITVYIIVYLLPAATLFILAVIALLSNPSNRDNQVVAANPLLYALLLFAEFIRHLLPISYSPLLVNVLFGNIGLLMLGVTIHMYIQISRLHQVRKIPLYPYILYIIPLVFILLNLFGGNTLTNSEEFTRQGLWIVPEYNVKYYGTMIGSVVLILISLIILSLGIRNEKSELRRKMLSFIRRGSVVTLLAMLILGFFSFGSVFPPHSYIFIGLIFSMYLVIAIYKFNLIPSLTQRYRTIFDLNPNALFIINERFEVVELNDAAKNRVMQYGLKGDNLKDMLSQLGIGLEFSEFLNEVKKTPLHHQTTISFHVKDEPVHLRIDGALMKIDSSLNYALIFREITKEVEASNLVNRLAYQDSLTGIANRTYFIQELEKALIESRHIGVLLLDLNGFKQINDQFGHISGDEVLKAVAGMLTKSFPAPHFSARLGGDEFVVLLEGITRKSQLDESIGFIKSQGKNFTVQLGEQHVPVEFSVGGAYRENGDTIDELLMRADEQMYKEKYKDRPHERNSFN